MCGLLHMCLPLELRFLGTVLEDYGKKDYHYLRDGEIKANNSVEIVKYRDLPAEYLRAKIFTSIALLHSANTACAQAIFDTIESNLGGAFSPGENSQVMDDVLTILTLAANHPAFLFEQKRRLYDHFVRLDNHRRDVFRDTPEDDDPPLDLYPEAQQQFHNEDTLHFSPTPLCSRHSPVPQPRKVCIQVIEVKDSRKYGDRPKDPELYTIHTMWNNGEMTEVERKFKEVQEFHRQMIDLFPDENRIPTLHVPNHQPHSNRGEHMLEQFRSLNMYLKTLSSVPSHILECDHMTQFFKGVVVRAAQTHPTLPPNVPYQPVSSMLSDEESVNVIQPVLKSMPGRNPHFYYVNYNVNDRIPRWTFPQPYYVTGAPQRFPPSHTCPYISTAHHIPPQQPSPTPGSQSSASSPANSRPGSPMPQGAMPDITTSVTQLLKLLSLEKYSGVLGAHSVEELRAMSEVEMSRLGLPREAQITLHSKLDQISEKPCLMNGLIDSPGYPSSSTSPVSPSQPAWPPLSPGSIAYTVHYRQGMSASPRSVFSAADSSPVPSDVASSPPSPGPPQSIPGKLQAGDSSDGSEDMDREKNEGTVEGLKGMYYGKSAQIKVSGRGGAGSPHTAPNSARMTPPDDPSKVAMVHQQHTMHPTLVPYYHQLHHIPTPGLLGQYIDPKGEVGLMGVAPGAHNSNNNNFMSEPGPIMSTGHPMRQPLLQAGVGSNAMRGPFKGGQPQPAHTNMPGTLQGKNLITMPADPKPGSPIITPMGTAYNMGLRPPDMQAVVGQGLMASATPTLETGPTPRLNVFHVPLGRGQGGPIINPLPPGHQAQSVMPYPTLNTRSVSTLTGSAVAMTVSSAHMGTTVTGSHVTTPNTTSQRSPSHNGNNGQRESVTDLGANDPTLRSSPIQGNGGNVVSVAAAPSPPALAHHVQCQVCNQGAYQASQVPIMYPFHPYWLPQAPNGLIPQAMSGFYAQGQPMASGVLTNGYGPEMFNYTPHPGYPVTPASHMHPMMFGNSMYQGMPAQQNAAPTSVSVGANGGSVPTVSAVVSGSQAGGSTTKPRKEGCYNCGSSAHKPSDCQENSMETMSGHFHLDFKPRTDSD